MRKEFVIDQADEADGFPLLSVLYHENGRATSPLMKTASAQRKISSEILQHIEGSEYNPDEIKVWVSALGATESWGPNRRNDGWPRASLMHKGASHGFKTFEQAHTFLHHRNTSPDLAVGKIALAVWNPRMDRVEVIQTIKRSLAPELCARIDDGEYIQTSMGAKVAHDICSLPWCRNVAKVAAEHCPDIKEHAGEIFSGGYQAYMVNPDPKFFDNSAVKTGAARESGMLAKIAHDTSSNMGDELFGDLVEEKEAYLRKRIDLDLSPVKDENRLEDPVMMADRVDDIAEVQSFAPHVQALLDTEPLLPQAVLQKASSFPLQQSLSTFSALGMPIRPEEFQFLFLNKAGCYKEANILYSARLLFDAPAPGPGECETDDEIRAEDVSEKLAEILQPYVAGRTVFEPYLSQRIEWMAGQSQSKIAEMATKTDVISSDSVQWTVPGIAAALALGYGVYRKMAPADKSLRTAEKAMRRHPGLMALLLASGAWGIRNVGETVAQPSEDHKKKLAGLMSTVSNFVLPVGGAYLLSASARRKEMEGYPLGSIERILRDYPAPVGVAGAVAAGRLRGKLKGVGKALKTGSITKEAGAVEDALAYTAVGWYSPYKFHAAFADTAVLNKIFGSSSRDKSPAGKSG